MASLSYTHKANFKYNNSFWFCQSQGNWEIIATNTLQRDQSHPKVSFWRDTKREFDKEILTYQ